MGALVLWLALACSGGAGSSSDSGGPAPRDDTGGGAVGCTDEWQTWQNTGQPLLLSWCTACHGARVTGDRRKGAPEGVDFDTVEGTRQWSARIDARLSQGDMPPAGGVPDADVARLRAWLACGAPGDPATLPDFGALDAATTEALSMLAETSIDPDDPAVFLLRRRPDLSDADDAWRDERYLVTDTEAWLMSVDDYDDGVLVQAVDFGTGLPLLPVGGSFVGSLDVTRTAESGTVEAEERWSVEVTDAERVDPMERSQEVLEILALSDVGDELGWHVSSDRGVVAAWSAGWGLRDWASVQIEAVLPSFPEPAPAFALDESWDFVERLLTEETP